jgi:hypothetical protein
MIFQIKCHRCHYIIANAERQKNIPLASGYSVAMELTVTILAANNYFA